MFRTLQENADNQQDVIGVNFRSTLSEGWAGPIGFATGLEWRNDEADITHDIPNQPWYGSYVLSYGLESLSGRAVGSAPDGYERNQEVVVGQSWKDEVLRRAAFEMIVDVEHALALIDHRAPTLVFHQVRGKAAVVQHRHRHAVRVGDDVVAIGNALALPGGPTVTEGIISAKDRTLREAGLDDEAVACSLENPEHCEACE